MPPVALAWMPSSTLRFRRSRSTCGSRSSPLPLPHASRGGVGATIVSGAERQLALVVESLPVAHKAVGAHLRVGADFGFELHGADGIGGASAGGLADKFRFLPEGRC